MFSVEHTPRMRVVDAVRISMSLPLFFTAIRNIRKDVYVDGGLFQNYPIKLFDRRKYIKKARQKKHARETEYYNDENKKLNELHPTSSEYVYNKETLGFRLDSANEISVFRDGAEPPREHIEDFFDYAVALMKSILNVQNNQHLHSDDWHRTIYIDTIGVGTTDFDLSDTQKRDLVTSGKNGVTDYFTWYDRLDPDDPPINHPEHNE